MSDPRHPFEPLPPVQEVDEYQYPQEPPRTRGSGDISSESYHHTEEPFSNVSPYYSSGSSRGGLYSAVGGSGPQEPDGMPLTSDLGRGGNNDYSGGEFSRPSDDSREDYGSIDDRDHGAYPGPRRRSGSGALWQQTRNTTWL